MENITISLISPKVSQKHKELLTKKPKHDIMSIHMIDF